ncbi:MAG: FeoA family protein [Nitrososphaerota archaeon]|nr:ferrous iron transport protein A [Candidatus Bathyarchaeota archaeon]MDW8022503.1 FeoA family protein [Nitrososphaerota archaeon]
MTTKNERNLQEPKASEGEGITTLIDLPEGGKGIIVKALGGFGFVRRLAEMGLTPGVEVKLLKKGSLGGPVEVEVRGVALALGRGVASKVFVKPVKAGPHD